MSQIPAMLEGCSLRAAQENFKVHLYTWHVLSQDILLFQG
jgi:hypothetical protein